MRVYLILLALAAASVAVAQEPIRPIAKHSGIRAVTDSTTKWNPQIQPTFRIGAPTPRNPISTTPPIYEENSIPVGSVDPGLARGTVGKKFPGITATGWFPPDPNIAVGPNHVVAVVNSDIAWFDKATGTKQFQVSMEPLPGTAEGFFEALGVFPFVFDPKAFYDPFVQRFFVVALEQDDASQTSKVLIAVSDDSDPNGTWHKYRFEAKLVVSGNATWLDYPGFGWNKDAIVITGNQFGFTSGWPGAQVIVIPKTPLLTGAAASQSQLLVNGARTIQVCHSYDNTVDKVYMIGQSGTSSSLNVYAVTSPGTSPVVNVTTVAIPSWVFPFDLAPSAGGRFLDTLDGRLFEADFRNGKIVAAHAVQVSNSDTRTMVRWYEINTNNYPAASPTLAQSGNVTGTGGEYYHMPGIGVNLAGDIALVFTRSSSSIVADVMVAGRRATDPPGTMGAPTLIKSSAGATYGFNGFNRWGDYHAMEVDPVDDLKFWSIGMLGQSNGNWTTEISSLTISDIAPGTSFIEHDPTSMNIYSDGGAQGENMVGALSNLFLSDNARVTLDSILVNRVGEVAALEMSFQTDTNRGNPKGITLRSEVSSTAGITAMGWLYDWTTGKYVQIKSFNVKGTTDVKMDMAATSPFPRFIGPGGQVKAVFRGLFPQRSGRGIATPFNLRLDEIELRVRY